MMKTESNTPKIDRRQVLRTLAGVGFGLATFGLNATVRAERPVEALPLDALLAHFGQMPGFSAHFREEKHIALLAIPIVSEGEIHFAAGRLLRRVASPPSVALIDADQLEMRSGDERQVISFSDNPIVANFVGSVRNLLVGDRAALERAYRIDYRVDGPNWTLVLHPTNADLRRFLQTMTFHGNMERLLRMQMTEVSGDSTTTVFSDVRIHTFTAAETARIFRI